MFFFPTKYRLTLLIFFHSLIYANFDLFCTSQCVGWNTLRYALPSIIQTPRLYFHNNLWNTSRLMPDFYLVRKRERSQLYIKSPRHQCSSSSNHLPIKTQIRYQPSHHLGSISQPNPTAHGHKIFLHLICCIYNLYMLSLWQAVLGRDTFNGRLSSFTHSLQWMDKEGTPNPIPRLQACYSKVA